MSEILYWGDDDAPSDEPPRRGKGAAHTPPVASPARVSQSTSIEQSRAVAEVQAAVVVAQQRPRTEPLALAAVVETCKRRTVAERAFYRFPRGNGHVTGESIHLAREIARCWGNLDYGIRELARDDVRGESEMLAFAWDLQTNTRVTNTFIAPHRRDRKDGGKILTELRDIYENNANLGARRLRECIFAVLPSWLIEEAKRVCDTTLEGDDTKPLAMRIADCIAAFDGIGIIVDQLETKLGRRAQHWTTLDVVQLGVIFRSITRGEVTKDEEFPPARVTGAEILAGVNPAPTGDATGGWRAPTIAEATDDVWPKVTPVPEGEEA